MSDIEVRISDKIQRVGVLIDPDANPNDVFDQNTGKTIEATNIVAEAATSRQALAKYYGKF